MSESELKAELEIMKEREAFKTQYADSPKIELDSCYCIIVYADLRIGTQDSKPLAIYECPLHKSGDMKSSCDKALNDCRNINKKQGRSLVVDEKVREEIIIEKQAMRKNCIREKVKNDSR